MENTTIIRREDEHVRHAYTVLKFGFFLAPFIAGIDKFFHILSDWDQYLAPVFVDILNITPTTFMMIVGVIEIIAGIGVLFKPKIFAYVVSAWILGISINLLILGQFYDVALRDFGLSIAAYALGQLATVHEHSNAGERADYALTGTGQTVR